MASKLAGLIDHWRSQCDKHVNGKCTTLACLKRGGFERNHQAHNIPEEVN